VTVPAGIVQVAPFDAAVETSETQRIAPDSRHWPLTGQPCLGAP
jgi:hypothetical protein